MSSYPLELQSILFPDREVCDISDLYYHMRGGWIQFDGYFNLFEINKRRKFTDLQELTLKLCCRGFSHIRIYHDEIMVDSRELEADRLETYEIPLPYGQGEDYEKGVFWFELKQSIESADDDTCIETLLQGGYQTLWQDSREGAYPYVRIAIDICTFRRETYVLRNLSALKKHLLDRKDLCVSDHLGIYVIDNGQTIQDSDQIKTLVKDCNGQICILPNRNAGGAGGFTRGMLEVLKENDRICHKEGNPRPYSHILVMDDDAIIEPDSIVRIYGFLKTLKTSYSGITLGGSMLREDYPWILYCQGESWEDGNICHTRINEDLRLRENCTREAYLTTVHTYDRYSGWWLCCMALANAEKMEAGAEKLSLVSPDHLPLPLFLHYDDIEYGVRNQKNGVVFLNGVNVWHQVQFGGSGMYYDTRNALIMRALHGPAGRKSVCRQFAKNMLLSILQLKWEDTELIYRGAEDYLKGPAWLQGQDPVILNEQIRKDSIRLYPIETLREQLTPEEYQKVERELKKYRESYMSPIKRDSGNLEEDFEKTSIAEEELHFLTEEESRLLLEKRIPAGLKEILEGRRIGKAEKLHSLLTMNGWLLPADPSLKLIFATDRISFNIISLYRKKLAVWCDPVNSRFCILSKDPALMHRALKQMGKGLWKLWMRSDRAAEEYRKQIGELTSMHGWEKYLGL